MVASLALIGAACSGATKNTEPTPINNGAPGIAAGTLEVSVAAGAVKLRNTTEQQIRYLVLDRNQAIIAIYPLCTATNCSTLVQGASATIPFAQIPGYNAQSTEAIVYWGRYTVRADGSLVLTGDEQRTTVKLK